MRILTVLPLFLLLLGCVSKKRYRTEMSSYQQELSALQNRLQVANGQIDSLGRALLFSQGGNALLLEAHQQLQDRLIGLEEEKKKLTSNLSNTQQSLSDQLQSLEAEKKSIQQDLAKLKTHYRELLLTFSQPLDSIAAVWQQDSLLQQLTIKSQSGSLSIHVPEEMIFQRNSQRLQSKAGLYFQRIADLLQYNARWNVSVVGHTDSEERRRPPYNWAYSAKQAVVVAEELANNYYISTNRISAVGKGDSSPLQSNATAAGRAANRRIEFRISNSLPYLLQSISELSED